MSQIKYYETPRKMLIIYGIIAFVVGVVMILIGLSLLFCEIIALGVYVGMWGLDRCIRKENMLQEIRTESILGPRSIS
jgi:ABC-type bacteriocin/lantibiotic exporter with double-glycine peptidase domain